MSSEWNTVIWPTQRIFHKMILQPSRQNISQPYMNGIQSTQTGSQYHINGTKISSDEFSNSHSVSDWDSQKAQNGNMRLVDDRDCDEKIDCESSDSCVKADHKDYLKSVDSLFNAEDRSLIISRLTDVH
eukprot:673128_1